MEQFENIIIAIILILVILYLFRNFYSKWKSLTDPSSPPSCGDGCGSCPQSSCDDREFPTNGK
ncbi:FeoB-associated Cys-rich membrane protein [Desulforhopalus sp. 52FAK]